MKKILIVNQDRMTQLDIPLFGKIKWKVIKHKEILGQSYNMIMVDEIVKEL